MFDEAKNEAEKLAQEHPEQASQGMDKIGQEADQMTGNRFDSEINTGMQDAEQQMGMQQGGQGQDPNQGQGQGQDPNQDQGQGQYQDPNQDQGQY
jgi:hypothetical protein